MELLLNESKRVKNKRQSNKLLVLSHYGNGQVSCVQCGFSDVRALSLDHIHNDGGAVRRVNPNLTSYRLYQRLIKFGLPKGYQTLCMNCQTIKEHTRQQERLDRHP